MATRVQWLGHSALMIETDGKRILVDPFFTDNPAAAIRADEVEADHVLVSHGHFDHVGDAVSIAKRTGATVVTNFELGGWFTGQGVASVHGMQPGGGCRLDPTVHVKLTPAVHGSTLPDGSGYGGLSCGFLLTCADGTRIYAAADTALFGDMRLIGEEGLDLAIVPIGDYFTMGPADSIRAIKLLEPKAALPIHYDTFPPIKQDARAWADRVRRETGAEPVVPAVGDWHTIR